MKIEKNKIIESLGFSCLLLVSFYFYQFTHFSVSNFHIIIIELTKIFILLFFLNFFLLIIIKNKFYNFLLFFYLLYQSIFILKLAFNSTETLTLHLFLENLFKYFFTYHPGNKPVLISIISYLSPIIFISFLLILFRKNLNKLKSFYVIFGFIVSFIMIYDLLVIYKKDNLINKKNINNIIIKDNNIKNKKVLWILLDALDPEYLNTEVDKKKVFKTFNNLKKNGFYHYNIFPPAIFTILSMPSQLLGINIKEMKSRHRTLIFKNLNDEYIPFTFENSLFGKVHKFGLDVSLMSSVLEYCSSYLVSSKWHYCEDKNSKNTYPLIVLNSLKFYFGFLFKFKNYFSKIFISKNLKKEKINLNDNYIDKTEPINFFELDFKNLNSYQINTSTDYADHENIINIDKIINLLKQNSNLTYLHIYSPHSWYKDGEKHILKKFNINKYEGDGYLLKYYYSDLFVNKIIEELYKLNDPDIMLIISSDHWHRTKSNDPDYTGNAFLLAKFINDDTEYYTNKESNSIIISDLIIEYFSNKINSNKDIHSFFINSNPKINIMLKK